MCLTAKKGIRVAERDIKVYKVVSAIPGDRHWYPVYFGFDIAHGFGVVCEEGGADENSMRCYEISGVKMVDVGSGFFHSTRKLGNADAVYMSAGRLDKMRGRRILMCEAVIPAGTRYYTDLEDYASERIIVKDPLAEGAHTV